MTSIRSIPARGVTPLGQTGSVESPEERERRVDALAKYYASIMPPPRALNWKPKPKPVRRSPKEWRNVRVRCVETGEVFDSMKIAAEFIDRSSMAICQSLREGCRAGGFHWEYADAAREQSQAAERVRREGEWRTKHQQPETAKEK